MGVRTKADEILDVVRGNISKSYNDLLIVLNEDTYGNEDLSNDYKIKLHDIVKQLMEIKNKL